MEIDGVTGCQLIALFHSNRSVDDPWYTIFVGIYAIFTFVPFILNLLVLLALHLRNKSRNKELSRPCNPIKRKLLLNQIPRDVLIVELAISDLLLVLTTPFISLSVLSMFWPFSSNNEFACQFIRTVPPILIYLSSLINLQISFNCWRQINCPFEQQLTTRYLRYISPASLLIAIGMSIPRYICSRLYKLEDFLEMSIPMILPNDTAENVCLNGSHFSDFSETELSRKDNISDLFLEIESEISNDECNDKYDLANTKFCLEDWSYTTLSTKYRMYYLIFILMFQLLIPGLLISICYWLIYRKLKMKSLNNKRMISHRADIATQNEDNRSKQRNIRMASTSLAFFGSWLPINIYNILLEAFPRLLGNDNEFNTVVSMVCHLVGICSTAVNPIMYTYLIEDVRSGKYKQ